MEVENRIKKLRKEERLTQKQLADKVNVSPQVISNWERGYSHPGPDDIAKLSEVFSCTSDYLLGRSDTPNMSKDEEFKAFANDPELQRWFKELPKSDEEDLRKLKQMWDIIKSDKQK